MLHIQMISEVVEAMHLYLALVEETKGGEECKRRRSMDAMAKGVFGLLTVDVALVSQRKHFAVLVNKQKEGKSGVMKDGLGTHVTASFLAGFVVVVASDLVGVISIRMMNMKVAERVEPLCKGVVDCVGNTVKAEMDEGQKTYKGVSVKEYLGETIKASSC
ncbi:mitochondrial dicarboxylate carrier [Tanacetum coccineum]